jgi:hypothetical protein
MVELNKGKNTWYRKGYGDGLADGRKDGIEVAARARDARTYDSR